MYHGVMTAKQMADILVSAAEMCNVGRIRMEHYDALNKALWVIACELGINVEVNWLLRQVPSRTKT